MAGSAKQVSATRLAWRHRLHALGGLWGGIVLVVGILVFFVAFHAWRTSVTTAPATPVRGTIVRIALVSGGDGGDSVVIAARLPDGAIRQGRIAIAPQNLRGCRVGGPVILLARAGNRWSLSGTPCLLDGREIG